MAMRLPPVPCAIRTGAKASLLALAMLASTACSGSGNGSNGPADSLAADSVKDRASSDAEELLEELRSDSASDSVTSTDDLGDGTTTVEDSAVDSGSDVEVSTESDALDVSTDVTLVAPQITSFNLVPNPKLGLSLGIELKTDVKTTLQVTLRNVQSGESAVVATVGTFKKTHSTTIVMMRPETTYQVEVQVTDEAGTSGSVVKEWATSALPPEFPVVSVLASDPDKMAPGLTLISAFNAYTQKGLYFLLDATGKVVFYNLFPIGFIAPTPEGKIVANGGPMGPLCTLSLMGSLSFCTTGSAMGVAAFHHKQTITPEGNIVALGMEAKSCPECVGFGSASLVGDVIVEFTPTGQIVRTISVLDALTTDRICDPEDSGFGSLDPLFPEQAPTKDRLHSNSVAIDPLDGNYVVSIHNLHIVIKLDRFTGELIWALGGKGDFQLAPGGRWSWWHHAAVPGADQTILMYDNHPAVEPYETRAVEYKYQIKPGAEAELVAEQTWEYSPQPPVPSEYMNNMGEVSRLANTNILIVDASINQVPVTGQVEEYDPNNHVKGRVSEVTYPISTEVFQVEIAPPEGMPFGFWILGAARLTTFGSPPP